MDELTTNAGSFDRREALKRGGFVVGAAALWATPVVQTIGMRPAAGTPMTSNFCPEGQGSGQPPTLVWQYTGGDCDATDTGQAWNPDSKCEDLEALPGTVDIRLIRTGTGGGSTGTGGGNPDTWVRGIATNGYFELDRVGSNITFEIYSESGDLLQRISDVHTSCSQPLDVHDHFGAMMLAGGTHPDVTPDPSWATTGNTYEPGDDHPWDPTLDN